MNTLIKLIEDYYSLGIEDNYIILPFFCVNKVFPKEVLKFSLAMERENLLKYRFPDDPEITHEQYIEIMQDYPSTYLIIETGTGKVVSEITLNHFSGKSARLHFAVNPENSYKLNLYLGKTFTDIILNYWTTGRVKYNSYLDTLIGVTAIDNVKACAYVLRTGFKKVGIIPDSLPYLYSITDAMLSIKTREKH